MDLRGPQALALAMAARDPVSPNGLLGGQLRHSLDMSPNFDAVLAEAAGWAALDLLAACLRSAPRRRARERAAERAAEPAPAPRDAAAGLGRIERFVARSLARPGLGPALLCRELRISRSTLYALVQPVGVATMVRRHRLAEARRLLRSDEGRATTTEALAQRCGFGNAQALRRALKRSGRGASARVRGCHRGVGRTAAGRSDSLGLGG